LANQPKPEFPPLLPAGLHPLSEADLETLTVTNFKASTRRPKLWRSLMRFCEELRDLGIAPCRLWLNGSFLTEKVEPDDIDLIVEVGDAIYSGLGIDALMFIDSLAAQPFKPEPRKLNTFFLLDCTAVHPEYTMYYLIRKAWERDFGHALLSKRPKGIAILEVGP
jgi:hypothetical protein